MRRCYLSIYPYTRREVYFLTSFYHKAIYKKDEVITMRAVMWKVEGRSMGTHKQGQQMPLMVSSTALHQPTTSLIKSAFEFQRVLGRGEH